jgi:hypothetical protein
MSSSKSGAVTKVRQPATKTKNTKNTAKTVKASSPYKHFRAEMVTDQVTQQEDLIITFHKEPLLEICRSCLNLEQLWDDAPKIPAYALYDGVEQLRRMDRRSKSDAVRELITLLEQENQSQIARLKNLMDGGMISYHMLRHMFVPGTEIVLTDVEPVAGVVTDTRMRSTFFGDYLEIIYERLQSNGKTIDTVRDTTRIDKFSGVREISKLNVRVLNSEWREKLTERGRKYVQVALGAHYQNYQGHMLVKGWWSWSEIRAEGRMMVDVSTYKTFTSDRDNDCETASDDDEGFASVEESRLWMCPPWIEGFSFKTKQWGRFALSRVSDISFRDEAFDQLVLASDKKELVRSLVLDSSSGFQDIIEGKGGGCIFLLHGEPGVGKTLTAEAVSELLHRPLYSVSIGELGVDVESLEKNLRRILDVAQVWNAVILIDEADIFLEKRGTGDIHRNACVSIFLRLLEYHQGVLFLTTNRVREFDPAFYSRISIALRYGNLEQSAREQIWSNLLKAAGVTGLDAQELAKVHINGRQIKTVIRLAQGLARQQGVPVGMQHVEQTLEVGRQFLEDIKN